MSDTELKDLYSRLEQTNTAWRAAITGYTSLANSFRTLVKSMIKEQKLSFEQAEARVAELIKDAAGKATEAMVHKAKVEIEIQRFLAANPKLRKLEQEMRKQARPTAPGAARAATGA